MKKLIVLLFFKIAMQSQTINYEESFENFTNPERGFYYPFTTKPTPPETDPITPVPYYDTLANQLAANPLPFGITLIQRIIRLDDFRFAPNTNIPDTFLDLIKNDFTTLRNNGLKCILRFCYSSNNTLINPTAYEPATAQIIEAHINQLKVITKLNEDVISSIEAGFIGKYGEWTISNNFGPGTRYDLENPLNLQKKNDRIFIGKKIMELTNNRMVAFRTPYFQQIIINSLPATPVAVPYDNSIKSRIAAHNDCFLRDSSDGGTFANNPNSSVTDETYFENQTKYTFCGGETCMVNNVAPFFYTGGSNALIQMKKYHFNNLNFLFKPEVIANWNTTYLPSPNSTRTYLEEMKMKLGYRYVLNFTNISNNKLTINLKNVGFANVTLPKKVFLILKNTNTGTINKVYILTDVRKWNANSGSEFSVSLINIVPNGDYSLFLGIEINLTSNVFSSNSIRLANKYQGIDTWESSTGFNNLFRKVSITATTATTASRIKAKDDTFFFDANAYPNPFSDTFKLDISTSSEETITLKVYDMIGKLIENKTITILELNDLQVGNGYKTGVYNIVVTQGENTKSMRVVKN